MTLVAWEAAAAELELAQLRDQAQRKLNAQAARAMRFQMYYDGDETVVSIRDREDRLIFDLYRRVAFANWCQLVVDAVAERLQVVGFRFDGADERAWEIWQASSMDADAELAQTDALVSTTTCVLVQPDADNPTGVAITPESPLEACVLYEPGNRRRRVAGYKRYVDDDGTITEVLITPAVIATWHGAALAVEPNPAGLVGMVEVVPQPRTYGEPRSELTPALAIQDRINTTIFNRMVATDYAAFRQAWATGAKLSRDAAGKPKAPFDVGANRLLVNENPDGRFGSLPESNLGGYLQSVEQDVQQLAAITQTPPHYLVGQMINLSADAIKAAETGLVAKVSRRARHIGECWEEVMRTALRITGDPAAGDIAAEVQWADFETRSEGQRVDALVKMETLGVPREVLWQRWGATPQEIERWKQLAAAEQAQNAAAAAATLAQPGAAYEQLLNAAGRPAQSGQQPPQPGGQQ